MVNNSKTVEDHKRKCLFINSIAFIAFVDSIQGAGGVNGVKELKVILR